MESILCPDKTLELTYCRKVGKQILYTTNSLQHGSKFQGESCQITKGVNVKIQMGICSILGKRQCAGSGKTGLKPALPEKPRCTDFQVESKAADSKKGFREKEKKCKDFVIGVGNANPLNIYKFFRRYPCLVNVVWSWVCSGEGLEFLCLAFSEVCNQGALRHSCLKYQSLFSCRGN